MKLTSEVISVNLDRLEKAQKEFPILSEYQKTLELKNGPSLDQYLTNLTRTLKDECLSYGLKPYIEFIDFIVDSKLTGQEIFYRKKIKNKEFQDVLVANAIDEDAKKSFKSKSKKSFEVLVNSKKWEVFTANVSNRRRSSRRYNNNIRRSDAIISNYIIQNQIEVKDENSFRVNKYYLHQIPVPDLTIKNEINRTKEIIDFIINKLSESGTDFRKVNYDHLTKTLNNELKNRMLTIEPGEKIKCVETSPDSTGLTLNKVYDVLSKHIDYGVLKVIINNDNNQSKSYNYRLFETVSNLRNSALDELLNNL
jgi:uncharacterized membrane protein YheB (UPF0754 family)